ncbi:type I restriction-modification system S protein [Streptococcus pneumoniae]|nr:type I restriction-modification system S protein [Streptococcus pneumoniae]
MRIKSIYWNFGQNKPEKSFRYIDTSSIDRKKNIINYKNLQYLSPEQAPSRARKLVSQNSVLFSTVRPYLKNIAVVRELKEYLIASTAFIVLDTLLNETYLKYYLLSDNFINRVNNKSTGTSYPAINDYNFNLLLIALPPLAEQQRIIEAIESALEKVDEYAESYNRLEQLDKEFPDKLKKSILQYAMQGKLVEQDPNDESVEVLLEKIRAEKQKLFEEGKIKKKDLDISIVSQGDDNSYYEEVPCEIPESWEWVRLNDITSYIQRGKSPKYSNIPIYPVIAQKCNQWSGFSIDLARFIDPETVHSYQKERLLRDGDLMWNFVVWFLGATGARVSELIKLKVEHVEIGYFDIYSKGGKIRRLYIPKKLRNSCLSWLESENRRSGYLFLNKFNEPITARGVAQQLKNYADKYKMNPKVIYPHSFRHLFAKNFLAKYNDIALLADLMGHESIETTRIYLRKTATEQQNIVDKIVNW